VRIKSVWYGKRGRNTKIKEKRKEQAEQNTQLRWLIRK
jgi:hypothetical protein